MWVQGKQYLNEDLSLWNFSCYIAYNRVNYEIGVGGQKTLTYACMTLLLREKSEKLYLSSKGKKVHFRWLKSQRFYASQWLCKIFAIFPFFDVTKLFSCTWTIPDMVRKFVFLGSIFAQLRIVLFYYTCKFTLSWTENCLSAETWVDFLDKPLMDGREVHVLWRNGPI